MSWPSHGLLGLFSALAAAFSRYHNPISDSISPVSIITLSSFFVLHLTKAGKAETWAGKRSLPSWNSDIGDI